MTEPDYIVFRAAPDLPVEHMPSRTEGWWYDRTGFPRQWATPEAVATAVPAGRFEVRADGEVAEVWEVSLRKG